MEQNLKQLENEWAGLSDKTKEGDAIFYELMKIAKANARPRSGPGTTSSRLTFMLEALAERFPEAHEPFATDPPELRYLKAIDALINKEASGEIAGLMVTRHDAKIALKQLNSFIKNSKDDDVALHIGDNISVLTDYVEVSRERFVDEGIWDESSMRLHMKEAMDAYANGAPYDNYSPHYSSFKAGFKSGYLYRGGVASTAKDIEEAKCWRTLVSKAESDTGFLLPNGASIKFGVGNQGILKKAAMEFVASNK